MLRASSARDSHPGGVLGRRERAGWDIRYGARLVTDLHALDLVDVRGEYIVRDERGGSPAARLFSHTLDRPHERMLLFGAAEDDITETQRLLRDAEVGFRSPSTSIRWGRRPVSDG